MLSLDVRRDWWRWVGRIVAVEIWNCLDQRKCLESETATASMVQKCPSLLWQAVVVQTYYQVLVVVVVVGTG